MSQIYNPYQFGLAGLGPVLGRIPRPGPQIPSLTPQEEQSQLSKLGATGGTMLGWLGESLSKAFGGRAIRGLLGGRPEELLSIIPFSDTLEITDPVNEVHGSELFGNKEADFLSPAGLGGFGLEVLTDPATYLTLGASALTKAGKVAKKTLPTKFLPKTGPERAATTLGQVLEKGDSALASAPQAGESLIAGMRPGLNYTQQAELAAENMGVPLQSLLGEKLGGSWGFQVPFTNAGVTFANNPIAQTAHAIRNTPGISQAIDLASPYLGKAYDALAPFGRGLKAMFQPAVMGDIGKAGQEVAPKVYESVAKGKEAIRSREADLLLQAEKAALLSPEAGQELRAYLELGKQGRPGVSELAEPLIKLKEDVYNDYLHWGGNPKELVDEYAKHFPRQMRYDPEAKQFQGLAGRRKLLQNQYAPLGEREDIFKNIPEATGGLEKMRLDPDVIEAPTHLVAAANIRRKYMDYDEGKWLELTRVRDYVIAESRKQGIADPAKQWKKLFPDDYGKHLAYEGMRKQSEALADFWRTAKDNGILGFTNHPIDDLATYAVATMKAKEANRGAFLVLETNTSELATPGAKHIIDVLDEANIKGPSVKTRLQEMFPKKSWDEIRNLWVPQDAAASINHYVNYFTKPDSVRPIIDVIDYAINLFKSLVTSPFPAFHFRNFFSNSFQLGVEGALSIDSHRLMNALQTGKTAEGLAKNSYFKALGLNDAQATDELRKMLYQYRLAGSRETLMAGDIAGGLATGEELLAKLPGKKPVPTVGQLAKEYAFGGEGPISQRINPLLPETFGPVRAGLKAGQRIEELSRGAGFIELINQGMAPQQAAMRIRASLLDYSALTDFEKSFMKRLVPFYSFSRLNIPYQIERLMQRPGGMTATAIKAAGAARGEEPGFLPAYLGQTTAVPIGSREDNTQRFLTQLGLPFEDLAQNMSARGLLGNISPYLKVPIEQATGQQIFSGRRLSDLRSPTGTDNQLLDTLLSNSPFARVSSLGRTVFDPRKGPGAAALNLLTGMRVSDVDMAKAENIAVRDYINENLRGPEVRRFQQMHVRPEDVPLLSPRELELYRLYLTRQRNAQRADR